MKPNYSLWEHWWYLGKMNMKWVEQLQELCFDRKELFFEEGVYLTTMDTLKDIYNYQPQIVNGKKLKKEATKEEKDYLNKSGRLNGAVEELLVANRDLEKMKYEIMAATAIGDEAYSAMYKLLKQFPEELERYCKHKKKYDGVDIKVDELNWDY